ncbi:MAG: DNA-binding transcriptional regulator Fis [Gammaproteobacteria bacterium]|nr:DNA-binding transcriptional regulator Fis [Gammaproteobacteria bacterium]NND55457.1 DNA-binding transcriptional regulator Fis [Gammaproteobacteria bacterium]
MTKKTKRKNTAGKKSAGAKKSKNTATDAQLQSRNRLLSNFTEDTMKSYFKNLNGHKPADIYRLVLGEVEPPLLRAVLEYTEGNQTLAADMLGLNRATLRKKLKQYDLRA